MSTPGSNILKQALSAIASTPVQYFAFVSRVGNAIGLLETTFAAPVTIRGSWQPVPRAMYEKLGLDFTKNYVTFYSVQFIGDVSRDRTGDNFEFNGKRWQVESSNDWQAIDGWNGVLCVEVPAVPQPEPVP
jgi:hypothetical protein